MFFLILIVSLLFANETQTRVLENNLYKITVERKERMEAEPISQPYEIQVKIVCKKNKTVRGAQMNFPVCDFDPQDKDTVLSEKEIKIAYYSWDAAKSSNNFEGKNYCNSKKKLFHEVQFANVCKSR